MTTRHRNGGFTLVELLVAMGIFLTIMGGVAALFLGAVRTVRQGNQTLDAFALARAAMEVLDRDLNGAFTARELGEYYQFFGRPEGFMFVGKLENGRLGRVTYVVHPEADTREFETELSQPWQDGWERTMALAAERASVQGLDAAATAALLDATSQAFQALYPAPSGRFVQIDEASSVNADGTINRDRVDPANETPIDFTVRVRTHAMLRYQEERAELDTFAPLRDGSGAEYAWPYIDPVNPAADAVTGSPGESVSESLYAAILSAINPDANPATGNVAYGRDLRGVLLAASARPDLSLHAVDSGTVAELLAARRREIWVRLLAGDPALPLPSFWKDPANPADPRPDPRDYAIAERILAQAFLLGPGGGEPFRIPGDGTAVDALRVPPYFGYSNADDQIERYFNAIERLDVLPAECAGSSLGIARCECNDGSLLPTYADVLADPDPDTLACWDNRVVVPLYGERSDAARLIGSPLAPRIPERVQPAFWLVLEKPDPGAADFRRWFTQTIDVPAGETRTIPPRTAPRTMQG